MGVALFVAIYYSPLSRYSGRGLGHPFRALVVHGVGTTIALPSSNRWTEV